MARGKKEDTGELMVSIDQFTKTRDAVIVSLTKLQGGLTHVQDGLNALLRTYMQHTASVIAGEDGDLEKLQIPDSLLATANATMEAVTAFNGVAQAVGGTPTPTTGAAAGAPSAETGKTKKRKREKKYKDPNAPKRPLTAAFLYAQQARPVVKKDLEGALSPGEKLEPNAVNLEVTKRWNEMPESEKEEWKASYRNSLEKYREEDAAYKATLGAVAEELHDEEEGSEDAIDTEEEEDSEEDVPVPIKTASPPAKTPRGNKRQKTTQVNGTGPVPIAPASSTNSHVPLPAHAGSRQNTHAAVEATPAKKDKKKKAAPQPIAPAPAATSSGKEPTPDDGKKKTKSGRNTRNTEVETEVQDKENTGAKGKKRDRSKRKSEGTAA